MKRILLLLCALTLLLAACTAQPVNTTEAETTTTEITTTETTTTTEATTTESPTTTEVPTTTTKPVTRPVSTTTTTNTTYLPTIYTDGSGYVHYPTDEDGRRITTTKKPAIYLYPTVPTRVGVLLETKGQRLTVTIPSYNTGWHVLAQPNGQLTNLTDGQTYPYLFWESIGSPVVEDIPEGFLVHRNDLEPFLREKLPFMGLIPAEYEEFIEFWLPLLSQHEYTLIYFAGEEYTSRFPLEITPAPDSMLRVFMVAKPATRQEKVAPQTLRPFTRQGFAVIEWGGTLLE